MNHDFQTLLEFLERLGPEVTGHGLAAPLTDDAVKLQRFAEGQCGEPERAEVCALLRLHPAWLRWLADRVKLARPAAQSGSQELPA